MVKKGEAIRRKLIMPSSSSLSCDSETEDLLRTSLKPPPLMECWRGYLSRQLSNCETSRDIAWERRRQQILRQQRGRSGIFVTNGKGLTDEDLHELKGFIELGFGFVEEQGQKTVQYITCFRPLFCRKSPDSELSPIVTFFRKLSN
ncbi:hypothetical protein V6N13_087799 [Hibiscus sabdariffa]|uniref:Uncharacterized protein n=1 Tax=Hibiscus sabdariffa TaxID=183260 RepID=A0ABR2FXC9_9ROSI